jgi:ABC-type multidrug transport system fused ATPase/permease subunit
MDKIAIARAILRSPNIILLDEATSSLDLETEKQIQESLESVCRSRTSITIAYVSLNRRFLVSTHRIFRHRLSTVANCDVIIVLQKGRVVESGSHEELLSLKGIYWKLWKKQIRK